MKYYKLEVRDLDVWGKGSDWEVNNSFKIMDDLIVDEEVLKSNRRLLSALREYRILSEVSKGKVGIRDVSMDYFEVYAKTGAYYPPPLISIQVIEEYEDNPYKIEADVFVVPIGKPFLPSTAVDKKLITLDGHTKRKIMSSLRREGIIGKGRYTIHEITNVNYEVYGPGRKAPTYLKVILISCLIT